MFIFVKSFIWSLIYSVFLFLLYNQVYRPGRQYPSDLNQHIGFIDHLNYIAHPLWHYSVKLVSHIFNISLQHSAILFTPFVIIAIFMIINKILEYCLKDELHSLTLGSKQYLLLFTSLILLIISAIYMPLFNKYIYLGQSACGVWHNVTLLMVKPFAFLSMFFAVLYIQTKYIKFFILSLVLTIISIFAKPNFIIMFLPSLYLFVLYYICKNETFKACYDIKLTYGKYRYLFIYLLVITFVSAAILISQFFTAFGTNNPGNSKIIFDFLGVWSLYTPNVMISMILTFLFPFLVFLFIKNRKSDMYILSIIMTIIAVLIYAFFAESGPRYDHGNFAWTVHIAYHILFVFSVIEFLKGYNLLKDWKKYLLSITLSLHIISGLYYFGRLLNGNVFF